MPRSDHPLGCRRAREFKEQLVSAASQSRATRDTNPLPHEWLFLRDRGWGAKGHGTQGVVIRRGALRLNPSTDGKR